VITTRIEVYPLTDSELCDMHELIRMSLLLLMDDDIPRPFNFEKVLKLWADLKAVRRQLGLPELEKL
jgi:hypothetical protein